MTTDSIRTINSFVNELALDGANGEDDVIITLLFSSFPWRVLILDMHFTLKMINMHSINGDSVNSIYMHLLLRLLIFH